MNAWCTHMTGPLLWGLNLTTPFHALAGTGIGLLRVHPTNPRYFTDGSGKPVTFIGDYTWSTFSDMDFDYKAQFDALKANGLNFARVWLWGGCEQFPPPDDKLHR